MTWHELAAAFAECHGERADNPYQIVDFATIEQERNRLRPLLGPGDEDHLLMALKIYFRFMQINAQIFDNSRLLDEGMPLPPKFTSYLSVCATRPSDRTVYQQMLDDE